MGRKHMQHLVVFLGGLLLLGCSANEHGWTGSFQKTKADSPSSANTVIAEAQPSSDATEADSITNPPKLDANAGKASDDDEGIPGYFQDISMVEVNSDFQSSEIRIQIAMDAVASLHATGVYLNAWIVDENIINFRDRVLMIPADYSPVQTGSAIINENGEYEMRLPEPRERRNEAILLTVDRSSQPSAIEMMTNQLDTFGGVAVKKNSFGKLETVGILTSNPDRLRELVGVETADAILSQDFGSSH